MGRSWTGLLDSDLKHLSIFFGGMLLLLQNLSFSPSGLARVPSRPRADALGCILAPLRGLAAGLKPRISPNVLGSARSAAPPKIDLLRPLFRR